MNWRSAWANLAMQILMIIPAVMLGLVVVCSQHQILWPIPALVFFLLVPVFFGWEL